MNIIEFGNSYLPLIKSELIVEALADSVGFVTTNYLTLMFPLFLGAAIYLTYFFGFRNGKAEFNFFSMGLPSLGVVIFVIWYFEITALQDGFAFLTNFIYETFM